MLFAFWVHCHITLAALTTPCSGEFSVFGAAPKRPPTKMASHSREAIRYTFDSLAQAKTLVAGRCVLIAGTAVIVIVVFGTLLAPAAVLVTSPILNIVVGVVFPVFAN